MHVELLMHYSDKICLFLCGYRIVAFEESRPVPEFLRARVFDFKKNGIYFLLSTISHYNNV